MLHPATVIRALYWSSRKSLRMSLGIQRPHRSAVLSQGADFGAAHYLDICRFFYPLIQKYAAVPGQIVSEIGCGDCLAMSDLFLAMGARRVDLIETQPITADAVQKEVLQKCAQFPDLPHVSQVLTPEGKIDSSKVTVIPKYLEHIDQGATYSLMISYNVLEHVEDIDGFFQSCHRLLLPGGVMIHKIDLSGHEFFEDPMPPLDFQTYPDWLYEWIFPKYRRATRRLQEEYLASVRNLGFAIEDIGIIRGADLPYIESLRPHLRAPLRDKPADDLVALDWFFIARKPE